MEFIHYNSVVRKHKLSKIFINSCLIPYILVENKGL